MESGIETLGSLSPFHFVFDIAAHLFGEFSRNLAMISRTAKQTEQDSDRQDDHGSGTVTGESRTETKDNNETGTNQTLGSSTNDTQLPKNTCNNVANSTKNATEKAKSQAHGSAHTSKAVDLVPSNDKKHLPYPYFPLNHRFPSNSFHHNYKLHHYNCNQASYYYHRPYPSHPPHPCSTSNHHCDENMAPFDDTTLATSNLSRNKTKNKASNRSLTIDTTHADSESKQHKEKYSRSRFYHSPYHPPKHGEYYRHIPSSHIEDGINRPHEQQFRLYESESGIKYEHKYDPEYAYAFSTTPIPIHTPQRSNTFFDVEARNRKGVNEEEYPAHPNNNDAVHDNGCDEKWKNHHHNTSNFYNHPSHYARGGDYHARGFDSEHQGRTPYEIKTPFGKNRSSKSPKVPSRHSQEDKRFTAHDLVYRHSGWHSAYKYPQEAFPPQEPYDRHYFSPSPPPPPYPDYYIPSSGTFTSRVGSPAPSWYEGSRGSYDEHDATRRVQVPIYSSHPSSNQSEYYHPHQQPPVQEEERERPGTPASNESAKTIVTPGKATERNSDTNHLFTSSSSSEKAIVTPGDKTGAEGACTFRSSSPFVHLSESDIVCGRGAPTNFHVGNSRFRELVNGYHRSYFVAKRSDKPRIAMKILDILASRGARFVRRIKGASSSASHWEEVVNKIAYEKVCQALRDAGGPPRKTLSSVAIAAASAAFALQQKQAVGGNHSIAGETKGVHAVQHFGEIPAGVEEKENGVAPFDHYR